MNDDFKDLYSKTLELTLKSSFEIITDKYTCLSKGISPPAVDISNLFLENNDHKKELFDSITESDYNSIKSKVFQKKISSAAKAFSREAKNQVDSSKSVLSTFCESLDDNKDVIDDSASILDIDQLYCFDPFLSKEKHSFSQAGHGVNNVKVLASKLKSVSRNDAGFDSVCDFTSDNSRKEVPLKIRRQDMVNGRQIKNNFQENSNELSLILEEFDLSENQICQIKKKEMLIHSASSSVCNFVTPLHKLKSHNCKNIFTFGKKAGRGKNNEFILLNKDLKNIRLHGGPLASKKLHLYDPLFVISSDDILQKFSTCADFHAKKGSKKDSNEANIISEIEKSQNIKKCHARAVKLPQMEILQKIDLVTEEQKLCKITKSREATKITNNVVQNIKRIPRVSINRDELQNVNVNSKGNQSPKFTKNSYHCLEKTADIKRKIHVNNNDTTSKVTESLRHEPGNLNLSIVDQESGKENFEMIQRLSESFVHEETAAPANNNKPLENLRISSLINNKYSSNNHNLSRNSTQVANGGIIKPVSAKLATKHTLRSQLISTESGLGSNQEVQSNTSPKHIEPFSPIHKRLPGFVPISSEKKPIFSENIAGNTHEFISACANVCNEDVSTLSYNKKSYFEKDSAFFSTEDSLYSTLRNSSNIQSFMMKRNILRKVILKEEAGQSKDDLSQMSCLKGRNKLDLDCKTFDDDTDSLEFTRETSAEKVTSWLIDRHKPGHEMSKSIKESYQNRTYWKTESINTLKRHNHSTFYKAKCLSMKQDMSVNQSCSLEPMSKIRKLLTTSQSFHGNI